MENSRPVWPWVAAVLIGLPTAGLVGTTVWLFWLSTNQTAIIPDVREPAELVLTARSGDGWPGGSISGVSVWVEGNIDGTAEIWLNGTDRQKLSGAVNWHTYQDWFDTDSMLYYEPRDVEAGELTVRFHFH